MRVRATIPERRPVTGEVQRDQLAQHRRRGEWIDDAGVFFSRRPEINDTLERTYGPRPWLTVAAPERWPPNRDELAIDPWAP